MRFSFDFAGLPFTICFMVNNKGTLNLLMGGSDVEWVGRNDHRQLRSLAWVLTPRHHRSLQNTLVRIYYIMSTL